MQSSILHYQSMIMLYYSEVYTVQLIIYNNIVQYFIVLFNLIRYIVLFNKIHLSVKNCIA